VYWETQNKALWTTSDKIELVGEQSDVKTQGELKKNY